MVPFGTIAMESKEVFSVSFILCLVVIPWVSGGTLEILV